MAAGLYVHVPFCASKCGYCDFYSVRIGPDVKDRYVQALLAEIDFRSDEWRGTVFETVYFGGGTPSLLSPGDLERILAGLHGRFDVRPLEISLECNPGTVDETYFSSIRALGVNRVSIGIQSLCDSDLRVLGRTHSVLEARQAFASARRAGIAQIGLDLMYGLPGQSTVNWSATLDAALKLAPDHLSLYELTLEPSTPLARAVSSGTLELPSEADVASMYLEAVTRCQDSGLGWYEISNFARPGCQCRHNRLYWERGDYLGLGPSAHSCRGNRRTWNPSSVDAYLEASAGARFREAEGGETIDPGAARFEAIMLGLRTRLGISEAGVPDDLEPVVTGFLETGLLERHAGNRLRLTLRGVLLSNEVFSRLR